MRRLPPTVAGPVAVCLLALVAVTGGGAAPSSPLPHTAPSQPDGNPGDAAPADRPTIAAVYPNPVADGDRGEFVILDVPPGTALDEFALSDDERTVRLPNGTASRRVVLSTAPNATAQLLNRPVRRLPPLELANTGERLVLRHDGVAVDRVSYTDANPGEVLNATTGRWRPLGATDRPVVAADRGRARVFVLPDAPGAAVRTLRGADRRILLAGYTLTSREVTGALADAARRNVTVRVLVDGAPVGGFPAPMARRLDRLVAAGAEVRVVGGERARYAFHHAKYAVVDGRALVTTENWKPAGTGGHGSRGWGAVTDQPAAVDALAATFRADAGWHDARPWRAVRDGLNTTVDSAATEAYPSRFAPRQVAIERARVLVAPDNAERAVLDLLGNATESVRIEQVSVGGRRQPFVRAALDAARRGVRVRLLLSGAWYVREDNRNLTRWLNQRARVEGLDLEARVADPRGRFGKIHAKGVVVDGNRTVVGSLNWNNHSARANREVLLVLDGEEPGRYFTRVFRADWRGGRWTLPAGVGVAILLAAGLAVWWARRIEFAEPP